jgi:radical SAM protein with 4Fe4S-binding SPASM domain
MAKKFQLPHISIEITSQCNLACRYCYNPWKRPGHSSPVKNSYPKAMKLLKHLFKIAEIDHVTFTGGEPFLAERFAEIVLYTRLKKKTITLISNGNIASDEDYKTMLSLGVGLFEFPLHSRDPKIHDSMTCARGSWERAMHSMKFVTEHGGYVVPVIVITRANYLQVSDTLTFLNKLGYSRIMLNRYNIGGTGIGHPEDLALAGEELKNTFRQAHETCEKLQLSVTSNVCTPFCLLNPGDYPRIGFGSCSTNVLQKPLTLDLDGQLRLCNHSPVIAGNIFKDKLETILSSAYVNDWVRMVPAICKDCTLWAKCLGGCRAASEQLGLTLDTVDPILNFQPGQGFR